MPSHAGDAVDRGYAAYDVALAGVRVAEVSGRAGDRGRRRHHRRDGEQDTAGNRHEQSEESEPNGHRRGAFVGLTPAYCEPCAT